MISIPRHLDTGAVATIGIILLLFLTISNTRSGTLQHLNKIPNKMPNKMIVKSATHTGQEGGEVDLRMPEALWLTLQEGDLAREIPATELRVPIPLLFHLQAGKSVEAPPLLEKTRRFLKCPAGRRYDEQGHSHISP
jgi:hypothetical protein